MKRVREKDFYISASRLRSYSFVILDKEIEIVNESHQQVTVETKLPNMKKEIKKRPKKNQGGCCGNSNCVIF